MKRAAGIRRLVLLLISFFFLVFKLLFVITDEVAADAMPSGRRKSLFQDFRGSVGRGDQPDGGGDPLRLRAQALAGRKSVTRTGKQTGLRQLQAAARSVL